MSLTLHEMTTFDQSLEMMTIRNEVREFMTHDQSILTYAHQEKWFKESYWPALKAGELIGYLLADDKEFIGYGLVSFREGKWWVSGGLVPEARGKGAGEYLFGKLTDNTHRIDEEEVWLDVLNTNETARKLYEKLGYVAISSDERMTVMVHRKES